MAIEDMIQQASHIHGNPNQSVRYTDGMPIVAVIILDFMNFLKV
jgi:hypothetical protein